MGNGIETLAIALYVTIGGMLKKWPDLAPARPEGSIPFAVSDAELLTMAVMSALPGFTSERRWLRYVTKDLAVMFPRRIGQSGCSKRVRKASWLFIWVIRMLAMDTALWSGDVWVVDCTPVECGRSRETVRRSDVAGWAGYGYCASRSRFFWELRLHLVCTLSGRPVLFAIAGAKAEERQTLPGMLEAGRDVMEEHSGQALIGDRNYFGTDFGAELTERQLALLRPVRMGEAPRAGQNLFKPLRQVIESVSQTLKGQLDLERHGGHTDEGIPRPRLASPGGRCDRCDRGGMARRGHAPPGLWWLRQRAPKSVQAATTIHDRAGGRDARGAWGGGGADEVVAPAAVADPRGEHGPGPGITHPREEPTQAMEIRRKRGADHVTGEQYPG